MCRKINLLKGSRNLLWFLALFCYYFQCPLSFLSRFIIPCLFAFMLLESKNFQFKKYGWKNLVFFYCIYISALLIFSIMKGNIITWALRFYMILLAIPICFTIKDWDFDAEEKIFIWLALAKSIMLIGIAIAVLWTKDFVPFRQWARVHSYGDIYIDHGIVKVQVQGNALLVVAFMLNYAKKKRLACSNIILLLGILSAGNFAFILGVAGFAAYQAGKMLLSGRTSRLKKAAIILVGIVGISAMIPYVLNQIEVKSTFSNRIRLEQAELLLDTNLLIGNGLGNKVVVDDPALVERFGRYTYYYELQTLYIFNQIGSIGLFLFYVLTLWAAYKNGRDCFWIYLLYLFYSFWNPYCFDTTQMMTIIAIINLKEILFKSEQTKPKIYRRKVVTVNGR